MNVPGIEPMTVSTPRKRRSELTFKHNTSLGRHGWLRLTPAYSVRLVQQILDEHDSAKNVVDPFSGTGTTPLARSSVATTPFPSTSTRSWCGSAT